MSFRLSLRSQARLHGVHPELVAVVKEAISVTAVDFSVVEGVRSLAKQREYFLKGKSRTMNSRHLTGHAVDLAPWIGGTIEWESEDGWREVARAMKASAQKLGVQLWWGFDLWGWDMPHFQLDWQRYPA